MPRSSDLDAGKRARSPPCNCLSNYCRLLYIHGGAGRPRTRPLPTTALWFTKGTTMNENEDILGGIELYDERAALDAAWCDRCGVHHSGSCSN